MSPPNEERRPAKAAIPESLAGDKPIVSLIDRGWDEQELPDHRLRPSDGDLHVVRWVRRDGRTVKHKYFRRRHDAELFAARLFLFGRTHAIFSTYARWSS